MVSENELLLKLQHFPLMYRRFFKRLIDLFLATGAFAALLPISFSIAILLVVANRSSPFFIQKRPGKSGKPFTVIKFKTMNSRRDKESRLLPDDQRLTRIGKWVRKTSLDEIPQLLNVIVGDMSLIGPRPLLMEYLDYYSSEQRRRHDVRPGITGWAQVNGRNAIEWDRKFAYDVWYVDNISFGLDLKIFFLTLFKVLKAEGISAKGHATMPTFIEFVNNLKKKG